MQNVWITYRYDGSFEGFLCCVFDSFYRRELPSAILSEQDDRVLLFPEHRVETDTDHAERVYTSLRRRISSQAADLVSLGFLTCLPERELLLLQFLRMGYRQGASVVHMLADDTVGQLTRAVQHLHNEAHLLLGFVRFSEYDGRLAAIITPKNQVLPLMVSHFCWRYPEECFLIYDSTHAQALLYRPHQTAIIPLAHFALPQPGPEEAHFRQLWQCFYNTVAIKGRENPKCRQGHLPKRYWGNMTEFWPLQRSDPERSSRRALP